MKELNSGKTNRDAKLIRRASAVILPLFFSSVLIASLVISVTNDMYAFMKSEVSAKVTVSEEDGLNEISKLLADEGIINNPTVFKLYVISKGKTAQLEDFSGELTLYGSMSYREILRLFKNPE